MSSTPSDPYLLVAFWTGVVSMALTVLVAAVVVLLRLRLRRQERQWNGFVARWRPLLMSVMVEPEPQPLPQLPPHEALLFLRLWAYLHESVRGDSPQRLNDAARQLKVDVAARALLERGSRAEQLLAILSVGHLRDAAAWQPLLGLASHPDGLISVNAARSLVQIDPFEGAQSLMRLILRRDDWDLTRVATFLGEAREAFWLLLVKGIVDMPPADLLRALRLADALRLSLPPATLRFLLSPGQPPPVVAGALRLAETQELGPEVRRCLDHEDWRVREQAVRQLGRLGQPPDLPALTALLEDGEWPVRLATAQTLAQLPFLDRAQLSALHREGSASHGILLHVLTEQATA